MTSTPPTAPIACPHGGLAPEGLPRAAKRAAVPADFWAFLQRSWALAEAERRRKERVRGEVLARRAAAAGGGDPGAAAAAAVAAAADAADAAAAAAAAAAAGADDDEGDVVMVEEDGRDVVVLRHGEAAHAHARGGAVVDLEAGDTAAAAAMELDGRGPGPGGGMDAAPLLEFPYGGDECGACAAGLAAAARLSRGLAARREAERGALAHLVAPGLLQLEPGASYSLLPAAFMDAWRAYMAQAGGRRGGAAPGGLASPDDVAQPPSLREHLAHVLCDCHPGGGTGGGAASGDDAGGGGPRLAFPPPAVANRRGRWVLGDGEGAAGAGGAAAAGDEGGGAAFELVDHEDWEAFVHHYGQGGQGELPLGGAGIRVTLVVDGGGSDSPGEGDAGGGGGGAAAAAPGLAPGEFEAVIGDDYKLVRRRGVGGSGGRGGGAGRGRLEASPPVCTATVAARAAALKAARLTYTAQEIMIETAPTFDEAAAGSAAAAAAARGPGGRDADGGGGERKSKRARKGRAPLAVDSSSTLAALKLRIFEAVGVHPRNAVLFVRGARLGPGDDESTLAAAEIYPGEEVRVVDTGEHDADDVAGLFAGGGGGGGGGARAREAERGFTGTALAGFGVGGSQASAEAGAGAGADAGDEEQG
jgi:hypothetical protein